MLDDKFISVFFQVISLLLQTSLFSTKLSYICLNKLTDLCSCFTEVEIFKVILSVPVKEVDF